MVAARPTGPWAKIATVSPTSSSVAEVIAELAARVQALEPQAGNT